MIWLLAWTNLRLSGVALGFECRYAPFITILCPPRAPTVHLLLRMAFCLYEEEAVRATRERHILC